MYPESKDHAPHESRAGDQSTVAPSRRLRHSLEVVFSDTRLQTVDAPPDAQRELRSALRNVCEDAREHGLHVEQLLVLIKDVWSGLPAGISRVPSVHGDERLNHVISMCVDEYYGDQETAP